MGDVGLHESDRVFFRGCDGLAEVEFDGDSAKISNEYSKLSFGRSLIDACSSETMICIE